MRISTMNQDHRIVSLISCIDRKSKNRKTGDMIQQAILVTAAHPHDAKQTGQDKLICGSCPIRRSCYTGKSIGKSIGGKYKAWKAGRYVETQDIPDLKKPLRVGEYGDPYFLDKAILGNLIQAARRGWTSYTHQWRKPDAADRLQGNSMASVESLQGKREANASGWRTFRLIPKGDPVHLEADEILCPYATKGTQCADCLLCCGTSKKAKNIAIKEH